MIEIKCLFKDKNCIGDPRMKHDGCRKCSYVPNFSEGENENKPLCAVAGYRDKEKQNYGSAPFKNPRWLSKALKNSGHYNPPCYDHGRVRNNDDGSKTVILEPYDATQNEIEELIAFCKENNLYFSIDGLSAHFPGRTIRILIKENKKLE